MMGAKKKDIKKEEDEDGGDDGGDIFGWLIQILHFSRDLIELVVFSRCLIVAAMKNNNIDLHITLSHISKQKIELYRYFR